MQSKVVGLDVDQLNAEISKTYTAVSCEPEREFIFPTGRAWAEDLDYPADLLARVPDTACESFAGVANPFSLGALSPGEHVLDLGSGAGMDSLVAAQMVGAEGSVTGIDMTPAMLERARRAADELGAANVRFVHGEAESLPFESVSIDVVISNGVIDLIPDKDAVFAELYRVLSRMDRRSFLSSATLLALGLGAAACGGGSGSASPKSDLAARFAKYRVASEPNGDLANVVWPSYVTNAPTEVKTLYEFQVTHGDLMKWMPCYCGCGKNAGHKSNRDCYVKSVRANGSVVFDPMAPT